MNLGGSERPFDSLVLNDGSLQCEVGLCEFEDSGCWGDFLELIKIHIDMKVL